MAQWMLLLIALISVQTPLLTVREVAQLLNLRESTVRAWLLRRRLAYTRVGKRAVRIFASEVDRVIDEGAVPARDAR